MTLNPFGDVSLCDLGINRAARGQSDQKCLSKGVSTTLNSKQKTGNFRRTFGKGIGSTWLAMAKALYMISKGALDSTNGCFMSLQEAYLWGQLSKMVRTQPIQIPGRERKIGVIFSSHISVWCSLLILKTWHLEVPALTL